MFCPNCGTQLEDGLKFCTECGTAVKEARQEKAQSAQSAPAPAGKTSPKALQLATPRIALKVGVVIVPALVATVAALMMIVDALATGDIFDGIFGVFFGGICLMLIVGLIVPCNIFPFSLFITQVQAHIDSGEAYYKDGDFDSAIAEFTKAIRLDPAAAAAYNNRGFAYRRKRDYDRAIADFTDAVKLAPDNADYKNNLAEARRARGW
jgi:tetratricopeptide (TPR) repeat protein